MQLTMYLPTAVNIDDIHDLIDAHLRQSLDDFSLLDTLYGLEFFLPLLNKSCVRQSRQRQRLEDDNYYLDYISLQYKPPKSQK